jgi:hypothetical protein
MRRRESEHPLHLVPRLGTRRAIPPRLYYAYNDCGCHGNPFRWALQVRKLAFPLRYSVT